MTLLSDEDQLIWCAKGIAEAINLSERQTIYLLEKGELPASKMAGKWFSTKIRLSKRFAELLDGEGASQPKNFPK